MGKKTKKKRMKRNANALIGCITIDGIEHEGLIYQFNSRFAFTGEQETLFLLSSWVRQEIKKFIGKKVIFAVNDVCQAYNIGLLDAENNIIKI